MGIKKTLAGIVLTAAASLMNLGCDEKAKAPQNTASWQPPVAQTILFSDDGTNTAMMVQEKDDYEVYVYNSANDSGSNVSQDPVNSDFPIAFAGNHAVTVSATPANAGTLKIYDSSGNLTFSSGIFEWLNDSDLTVCSQGTKIIFGAGLAGSAGKVYMHRIGSQALEEIVQGASYSYLHRVSQDKSLAYLDYSMPLTGQILAMYNTETETLTPVLNLDGHNVRDISKNNKKALIEYWTGSGDGLKVHDIDTNSVQIVNFPAGKTYRWTDRFSEDGTGAVLMMQDDATSEWNWYHLDTTTLAFGLIKAMPSTTSQWYAAEISPNGNIASILDENRIVSLYNQNKAEPKFYDPLSAVSKEDSQLVGFTLDNKVVLSYREPMAWRQNFVLHDPATGANTDIAETGYDLQYSGQFTPDRKYFVYDAEEDATGWEVLVMKDFVNNTTKIVKMPFASDCNYVGAASDSSRIYLRSEYKDLVAYDVANNSFVQITNNDSLTNSVSFKILGHSQDNKKVFFSQNNWNGTETIKQYDFDTEETDVVAYSD